MSKLNHALQHIHFTSLKVKNNLLLNCDQDAEKRFEDAVDQFNVRFNETTVGAETSLGEILSQLTNWFQVLKKKDLNINNSGQYGIGPGSCVLYTVFLPLLLPPSLHHLLQALPLSFLLQVNFTNNLISQISCAGCPAALSSLVDQEATAAREDNRIPKTSHPPFSYGGSGSQEYAICNILGICYIVSRNMYSSLAYFPIRWV